MSKKKLIQVDKEEITPTLWRFILEGSLIGRHSESIRLEVGAESDLSVALAPATPSDFPVRPCPELRREILAGLSLPERILLCGVVNQLDGVESVTFGENSVTLRLDEPPQNPEELEKDFVRILCEAFPAEQACVNHYAST